MFFGRVKRILKVQHIQNLFALFCHHYNLYKTAYRVFITITATLLYFASAGKYELQEVNRVQLIPISFPTLVPSDQPGNTRHNLKMKLKQCSDAQRVYNII